MVVVRIIYYKYRGFSTIDIFLMAIIKYAMILYDFWIIIIQHDWNGTNKFQNLRFFCSRRGSEKRNLGDVPMLHGLHKI